MTWRTLVSSCCLGGEGICPGELPTRKGMLSGRPLQCLAKKKEKRGADISLPAGRPSLSVPSTCAG